MLSYLGFPSSDSNKTTQYESNSSKFDASEFRRNLKQAPTKQELRDYEKVTTEKCQELRKTIFNLHTETL